MSCRKDLTCSDDLDRLLSTMDVAVQSFAMCEVRKGVALVGQSIDAIMLHYVLAGEMHMSVPGQPTIRCGPGCIALIPPGMQPTVAAIDGPQRRSITAEDASVIRDGMLVFDAADGRRGDLRMAAGVALANVSGSFGLFDKLRTPIYENMGDIPIVRQAYAMMLDEMANPNLGAGAVTNSLMKMCLLMLVRRFCMRPGADEMLIGVVTHPRLAAAIAAVVEKPSAPHSVRSLADEAGMGRSTFARLFTEAFAMGPMEFVAKTRLRHAAGLLRSTRIPIKVVAASTGFGNASHFSRAFSDAYGIDPTSFRRQSAMGDDSSTLDVVAEVIAQPA